MLDITMAAAGGGLNGVTTKLIGYFILIGGVCIALAATKTAAKAGDGDVKKGANSTAVTFLSVFMYAVAGSLLVIAGFMTGLINATFG